MGLGGLYHYAISLNSCEIVTPASAVTPSAVIVFACTFFDDIVCQPRDLTV